MGLDEFNPCIEDGSATRGTTIQALQNVPFLFEGGVFHLRSNVGIDVGLNVEAEIRLGLTVDLCPVVFVHPRGAGIIPDNVVCFIENKDSLYGAGPICQEPDNGVLSLDLSFSLNTE